MRLLSPEEILKKYINPEGKRFSLRTNENIILAMKEYAKEFEDLINSPEIEDFLKGVRLESAHQTERWGSEQEALKLPHDYALVLDKLKGKQALAIWDKATDKYKHHLITMAAVCFNMHRQIDKEGTAINQWFKSSL